MDSRDEKAMNKQMNDGETKHTYYPSAFAIGEEVSFGAMTNCKIHAVKFTEAKVRYDLDVPIDNLGSFTRIENVDSALIEKQI
jgi:hypothetical protein